MSQPHPEAQPTDVGSVFDTIDPVLKIVSVEAEVTAPAATVFELIADPARHADWDANNNVGSSAPGQRVAEAGGSFITTLTKNVERENHVIDFAEGRTIAWMPSEVGAEPIGHKWLWEVEAIDDSTTRVRQTYDWTQLRDPQRLPRAQSFTEDRLMASVERLKALAEG